MHEHRISPSSKEQLGRKGVHTCSYKISHRDVIYSIGNRVDNIMTIHGDKWLLDEGMDMCIGEWGYGFMMGEWMDGQIST